MTRNGIIGCWSVVVASSISAGCAANGDDSLTVARPQPERRVSAPQGFEGVLITQRSNDTPRRRVVSVRAGETAEIPEDQFRFDPTPVPRAPRESETSASSSTSRTPPNETDKTLQQLQNRPADSRVVVTLTLSHLPIDANAFRDHEESGRQRAIAAREAEIERAQDGIRKSTRALGARVLGSSWLANTLTIEVNAGAVAAIARLPQVRAASLREDENTASHEEGSYSVGRVRSMVGATAVTEGYTGEFYTFAGGVWLRGHRTLAVLEDAYALNSSLCADCTSPNYLNRNHPAYLDHPGGPSRVLSAMWCGQAGFLTGCWEETNTPSHLLHGSRVTSVALAGILQGQDPDFPGSNTPEQLARTGLAPEAKLRYYRASGCDGGVRALEHAVSNGVSVVSISRTFANPSDLGSGCFANWDCIGMNNAIRNAFFAGTILVKSAGNKALNPYSDTACSLTYPAQRPEIITVGGLQSSNPVQGDSTLGLYTSPQESAAPLRGTSIGPAAVNYVGRPMAEQMAGVSLMAPAWVDHTTDVPSRYFVGDEASGTSFAAPAVAGSALLMIDIMRNWNFGNTPSAPDVFTAMLLTGDAWDPNSAQPRMASTSSRTGMGRSRLFVPSALAAPRAWGWRTFVASTGTTSWNVGDSGPETGVRQWRWAVSSFPTDLTAVDLDYTIEAWDTCPPSGIPELVAHDRSFDIRKRVQLRNADICVVGRPQCRCLQMRLITHQAPPGGRQVWSSDFYHGGVPQ